MLEGIPLLDFAPATLLGLTVLLVLTGRLVPKSMLDKSEANAERWAKAHEVTREQIGELLVTTKTTQGLIQGIYDVSQGSRKGGESSDISKDP